ncbi:MAG: hypothetical protein RL235_456 [Chlamydiota bacterium]|jgi:hypothetical protein
MSFENIARWIAKHLTPLSLIGLAIIPIALSCCWVALKASEIGLVRETFYTSLRKGKGALERKERKERFLQRFSHSDPYFIDRNIESLRFLNHEIKELQTLLHHPAIAYTTPIEERLKAISDNENRLSFVENKTKVSPFCKEVEEKQQAPIQLDEEDLKKLLVRLEDEQIECYTSLDNSPQIIITDFVLEKIVTPQKKEVFEVQMELLKREFNP